MSEQAYLELLNDVLSNGYNRSDRTGIGSKFLTSKLISYDMSKGFPAVTTKKLAWKSVIGELLWMLEGSTNERRLAQITFGTKDSSKRTIWTANYEAETWQKYLKVHSAWVAPGYLGKIYGSQWRNFSGWMDQLKNVIDSVKNEPFSRRHIVTAWNPVELENMALPPCHILWQLTVIPDTNGNPYGLELTLNQRSCDLLLGNPFNVAFYSLLLHIIGGEVNLVPLRFNHFMVDAHIYNNHIEQVKEQLDRKPYNAPTLQFSKKQLFNEFGGINYNVDDFKLIDYEYHPPIKADMAV